VKLEKENSYSMLKTRHSEMGFSLVEILVSTVMVGLVLTAVATVMTLSIKNAAQARYRETATQLAQAGMEFFNRENALLSWSSFAGFFPENANTYCLEALPAATQLATINPGTCSAIETLQENGGVFTRQAIVSKSATNATDLQVSVITSWEDGARTVTVDVTKVFRKLAN